MNVRTYVIVAGRPSIQFLSLDADSRLAVTGARRSHRLPYFRSHMSARPIGADVQYESERTSRDGRPAAFRATYRRLNTMTAGFGIELPGTPLLHPSPRQDTLLWGLRPVDGS